MKEVLEEICKFWGQPAPDLGPFDLAQLKIGKDVVIHPQAAEYFGSMVPTVRTDTGFYELLSPVQIISENSKLVPGYDLCPRGFVTIATNGCGDAVALDLRTGLLMLFSHEVCYGADEIRWWLDGGWQTGPNSPETIRQTAELIFLNVPDFLQHWKELILKANSSEDCKDYII